MSSDGACANRAAIDAWRARGDDRFDRVRFHFIEALARRADAHEGQARRILDDRLAQLVQAYANALGQARCGDDRAANHAEPPRTPRRGALAELVEHIALHAPAQPNDAAAGDAGRGLASPPPELKTLRIFKSTWSRLAADRWLTQSLNKTPKNAGPLNSHHLMHRSLALMREVSPDYLNRFMAYVDALSWVDQADGAGMPAATSAPRSERGKKSARGKSG